VLIVIYTLYSVTVVTLHDYCCEPIYNKIIIQHVYNCVVKLWEYSITATRSVSKVIYSHLTHVCLIILSCHTHTHKVLCSCYRTRITKGRTYTHVYIYLIFHRQMQNIYWYNYIIHIYNLSTTQIMHVYAIIIVFILANNAYISPNVFINIATKHWLYCMIVNTQYYLLVLQ